MKKNRKKQINKILLSLLVIVIAFSPFPILLIRYDFSEIFNLWTCLFLLVWFFAGIVIHEAGHLIFGLLTGYRFISFQVGRTLIQKPTGKPLRFKRIPFNGLGGQCLMIPKSKENKAFFLFNYGGIIINFFIFLVLAGVIQFGPFTKTLNRIFISGLWMNYLLAVMNALPFIGLTNDGFNHRLYKKNPDIYQKILDNLEIASQLNDDTLYQDIRLPLHKDRLSFANTFDVYIEIVRFFVLTASHDEKRFDQIREMYQKRGSTIPIYGSLIEVLYFVSTALNGDFDRTVALYNNFDKTLKKQLDKEKTGLGGIANAVKKWLVDKNSEESKRILDKVLRKAHKQSYLAEEEQIKMLSKELADQIKRAENPALIILASKSPRRKEILANAHIHFDVMAQDTEENFPSDLDPKEAIQMVAKAKAEAVYRLKPKHLVIGADTIVLIDNEVLGKPKNTEDAIRMLSLLQGRTHQVITGVCIIYRDEAKTFAEVTEVTFAPMSIEEIQDYINKENVMDKAGAYAIQGMAGRYITGIRGEYYNVMGLPIAGLYQNLKERLKEYDLCALSLSEAEKSEQL